MCIPFCLKSVTIPKKIITMGDNAFYGCRSLQRANFMGDAPVMASSAFHTFPSSFTVYYFNGKDGFDSPVCHPCDEYPAVNMGDSYESL